MDRDEYERLKEAEKEHLRKLRDLIKRQHREAERKKGLLEALRGLTPSPEADETHAEMLRRLAEHGALAEARLEVAAEEAEERAQREAARAEMEAEMERLEEEQRKAEAADLVRQMKAQMLGGAAEARPEEREEAEPNAGAEAKAEARPAKSIGRPRERG